MQAMEHDSRLPLTRLAPVVVGAVVLLLGAAYLAGPPGSPGTIREAASDDEFEDVLAWDFSYDDAGRLAALTAPGGRRTDFRYTLDASERIRQIVTRSDDGQLVSQAYDERGRPTTLEDPQGGTSFTYDPYGRLIGATRRGSPTVSYDHDSTGRVIGLRVGSGGGVTYEYDFLGRLSRITSPAGVVSYEYLRGGAAVVRTLPNGVRTEWQYDARGNLTTLTHLSVAGALLLRVSYGFRPDGLLRTSIESSPRGERSLVYDYDTIGRLLRVNDSRNGIHTYVYDEQGRRTRQQAPGGQPVISESDALGRLITHGGRPAAHDAEGRLAAYGRDGGEASFTYDRLGRLVRASRGVTTVEYEYDGYGSLIARVVDGTRTTFVADPTAPIWRPLLARTGDADTLFVWEGAALLATIGSDGATSFFLHDHLGSSRAELSAAGVSASLEYDPFGTPLTGGQAEGLHARFAGLFYDTVSELYLTRARAYDPRLGRFLQRDPKSLHATLAPEHWSPYGYAGSDPVNYVDLDGSERRPVWGALAAAWQGLGESATYAKQYYAALARNAVERGNGWAATGWDVLGGYIPGRAANDGQNTAQVMWSVATLGGWRTFPALGQALAGLGIGRTAGSSGISSAEGDYRGAALDLVSLGGTRLGVNADDVLARVYPGGQVGRHAQLEFGFVNAGAQREARRLRLGSMAVGGLDLALSVAQLRDSEPIVDALRATGDRLLNLAGTGSNWIGRNRSGGRVSFERDRYGEFPLGDTTVGGRTWHDWRARWHDVQYWVDVHAPQGQWVQVPGPGGREEYFRSRGSAGRTNAEVLLDAVSGFSPAVQLLVNSDWRVQRNPPREGFTTLDALRQQFPVGTDATLPELAPARVGGVYLAGAGAALAALGAVRGVALDRATGRLVLIGDEENALTLPALSLDDVVTIFRAVYEHGSAPMVSIDPDPRDPNGPTMLVRHDRGTERSFVGWVLFESDRLMKAYSLGEDNVTRRAVSTAISGYRSLLDTGGAGDGAQQAAIWERFWIVPDTVDVRRSRSGDVTLIDVSLKVNTEQMRMEGGKLVPAGTAPSAGAQAFARWFTSQYERIASESRSTAPAGTSRREPVAVFAELRRIAVIAAGAEALRDQGVPLPAWMRDYQLRPLELPTTTPAITVRRRSAVAQSSIAERRIYGGVSLSPADVDVTRRLDDSTATAAAAAVTAALRSGAAPAALRVQAGRERYALAVLPGAEAIDLPPARLREVDLSLPIAGPARLELVREYHSFFRPVDVFGPGWTLDLPRLEPQPRPRQRTARDTLFNVVPVLTSPLGTFDFNLEPRGDTPDARRARGPLRANDRRLGRTTDAVVLPDGARWHFDPEGNAVAVERPPFMTVWQRDPGGNLERMEAWYGSERRASIVLEYRDGRVVTARGSDGSSARYAYGSGSRLQTVVARGATGYRYDQNGLVAAVARDGVEIRRFGHDDSGRLQREVIAGLQIMYSRDPSSPTVTAVLDAASTVMGRQVYGPDFRPLESVRGDGTSVLWKDAADGWREAEVRYRADGLLGIARIDDGARTVLWRMLTGGVLHLSYDRTGRVTSVLQGDRPIIEQEFADDGRLVRATVQGTVVRPGYAADGLLEEIVLTDDATAVRLNRWLRASVDRLGRITGITDYSGGARHAQYDEAGNPVRIDGAGLRVDVSGNAGRGLTLKTSDGRQAQYAFDPASGAPQRTEWLVDGQHARVDYDSGLPSRLRQFDGGEWRFQYRQGGISIEAPNGLVLDQAAIDDASVIRTQVGPSMRVELRFDRQGRMIGTRVQTRRR